MDFTPFYWKVCPHRPIFAVASALGPSVPGSLRLDGVYLLKTLLRMKFISWNVNGLRACKDKGFD